MNMDNMNDISLKDILEMYPDASMKDIQSLVDTFDEWAGGSFDGCVSALTGKSGIDDPNVLCSWMCHEATGEWPAEKSGGDIELTWMFVTKNKTKKIVHAPVLVPGEADSDGEFVTKDKIEEVAHRWLMNYAQVDHSH